MIEIQEAFVDIYTSLKVNLLPETLDVQKRYYLVLSLLIVSQKK